MGYGSMNRFLEAETDRQAICACSTNMFHFVNLIRNDEQFAEKSESNDFIADQNSSFFAGLFN